MQREREKKSWREVDKGRDRSGHRRDEIDRRREQTAQSNTAAKQYRSALEALFTPKEEAATPAPLPKTAARIVLPPNPNADPRNVERRRLLAKLLAATGPAAITKAANAFTAAGFTFPEDQETYLQLLEHTDEDSVRQAIVKLTEMFAGQMPKRKPVLEQRLRRIEEQADDDATREAAKALRRILHGRK